MTNFSGAVAMSRSIRFAFIVLHYNEKSLADTHECVESILKLEGDRDFRIVVVENGSGDSSADELQKTYASSADVDVLVSDENLGFANGNNLGCRHAVDRYSPKFLIVINNDTVMIQPGFMKKITEVYERDNFDILGPYIFDKNREPQNPFVRPMTDLSQVEKKIRQTREKLDSIETSPRFLKLFRSLSIRIKAFFESFRVVRLLFIKGKRDLRKLSRKKNTGCAVHGSALVFSEKYFRKYSNVFYEKTFMFVEEDILYQRVIRDHLVSVYCPDLKIFHKEDSSTNSMLGTSLQKKIFTLEKRLASLQILADVIREGEKV